MRCVLDVLTRHRRAAPWRLSPRVALLASSYALVIFIIDAGLLAFYRPQPRDWLKAATAGLYFITTLSPAAASLAYVYVSSKAPRSSQLHLHGFALLATLTNAAFFVIPLRLDFGSFLHCAAADATRVPNLLVWGVPKAAIFIMVREKVITMGSRTACCVRADRWCIVLVVSAMMVSLSGAAIYAWSASLVLKGLTCEEAYQARSGATLFDNVPPVDTVLGLFLLAISTTGAIGLVVAGSATVYVANQLRRRAVSKLVDRQVQGEELANVKGTLGHHVLGMFASIASTQAVMAAAFLDGMNFLGEDQESWEVFLAALVSVIDVIGDVTGILLLSGIGALLICEDPEAGDISGHIRSILHSAVLTSQAEMVFEGRVDTDLRNKVCIASFPGKFLGDWHALTWACEQGDFGSACVFLPKADPLQRFGRHAANPETPGKCWCHSLYGAEKPWGCCWFVAWKTNVDLAAEQEFELLAVFFPGEAGKGIVEWSELGNVNLWDGVGLGGSQKSEVAYMKKQGLQSHKWTWRPFGSGSSR